MSKIAEELEKIFDTCTAEDLSRANKPRKIVKKVLQALRSSLPQKGPDTVVVAGLGTEIVEDYAKGYNQALTEVENALK